MSDELRVAIIGYGMTGRAHAYAYRAAPLIRPAPVHFVPVVMTGRDEAALAAASSALGVDEWMTDWRDAVARTDVDVVDICTPPGTHAEIAIAAAAAGKAVVCEKPLATSYADAASGARRGGGGRRSPRRRVQLPPPSGARVDGRDGGEAANWARYNCGAGPGSPMSSSIPTSPSTGVSSRRWAARPSPTSAVISSTWRRGCSGRSTKSPRRPPPSSRIGVRERPSRRVEVDDASSALVRFASGVQGTMEVARVAPRRPCDFIVEVNGSRGTASFSYAQLNELWFGCVDDDVAPLRSATNPRRTSPPPRDGGLVADWPRSRLRSKLHQLDGRPRRVVAERSVDTELRRRRASGRRLRGDGVERARATLGRGRRSDR